MADEQEVQVIDDVDPEETPGYKAPAQKAVSEIHALDADDESLVKYKQTLLGGEAASPADDPRRVIVEKMSLLVEGRKDMDFDLTGDLSELSLIVKEGTEYKLKIWFKVHHEIVAGLRYHHVVKRKGLPLDKASYMVGSYGPKAEQQSWTSPPDDAPKGMVSRGSYKVNSKFVDDDKNCHLEWNWKLIIEKDWAQA